MRIKNGIIIISPQHTTTAVFINDDEEGLLQDILELLEKIVSTEDESSYKHNRYEEDATAHLKRILLGRSEIVSVTDGKLKSIMSIDAKQYLVQFNNKP